MIKDEHIIKKSPAFTTMELGMGGASGIEKLDKLMMKDTNVPGL